MTQDKINIDYYSDVLCVWAYIAQIRLDELNKSLSQSVSITPHFISLFANTEQRIGNGRKNKGGFDGFAEHVQHAVEPYPHSPVNQNVWTHCRPSTSANAHLFIRAFDLALNSLDEHATNSELLDTFIWKVRCAFFQDAKDISQFDVLQDIVKSCDVDVSTVMRFIENGKALAAIMAENQLKETLKLEGSPTYVFNNGRQKLYGNVGYKIIEANINELLSNDSNSASWC